MDNQVPASTVQNNIVLTPSSNMIKKRPILLIIIGIITILFSILVMVFALGLGMFFTGPNIIAFAFASAYILISILIATGLIMMKKWAMIVYVALAVIADLNLLYQLAVILIFVKNVSFSFTDFILSFWPYFVPALILNAIAIYLWRLPKELFSGTTDPNEGKVIKKVLTISFIILILVAVASYFFFLTPKQKSVQEGKILNCGIDSSKAEDGITSNGVDECFTNSEKTRPKENRKQFYQD